MILTRLIFRLSIRDFSKLQSGYSQDMLQFLSINDSEKISVNAEYHKYNEKSGRSELNPGFTAASLRGLFRNASAFLLESLNKEEKPVTCAYSRGRDKEETDTLKFCQLCNIYGGTECGRFAFKTKNEAMRKNCSIASMISFSFGDEGKLNDIFFGKNNRNRKPDGSYEFAWSQIGKNKDAPLITKDLVPNDKNKHKALIISLKTKNLAIEKIASVLLAADFISSGFFRAGRFTSKGYGFLEIVPMGIISSSENNWMLEEEPDLNTTIYPDSKMDKTELSNNESYLMGVQSKFIKESEKEEFSGNKSGFNFFKEAFSSNPIRILSQTIAKQK